MEDDFWENKYGITPQPVSVTDIFRAVQDGKWRRAGSPNRTKFECLLRGKSGHLCPGNRDHNIPSLWPVNRKPLKKYCLFTV
jgi:hypothetical protein